jgi:hypothetical protein
MASLGRRGRACVTVPPSVLPPCSRDERRRADFETFVLAQVLALIPLYATIAPVDSSNAFTLPDSSDSPSTASIDPAAAAQDSDFSFTDSLTLLTPSAQSSLVSRFRKESDAYYLEAKRSMVASRAQIPVWIYGVLVLLGWNEFIAVIRSPIYFTMLLLIGAGAYVTYTLNMVRRLFSFFSPAFLL